MERAVHGGDEAVHPDIAASLHELGFVCSQEGDYKEARRFHEESLQMVRAVHGGGEAPGSFEPPARTAR